ncbi:T9SS type A sorting domain-containing protein [Gaetbulibacter aestuarii]|uniref:T9SS type A sorting domain-containing protein n=1 Tax=Gaetbulibacter aestuarii TaxID=1502358 RepID=A0ABW7N0L5_9FLAO
MKTLNVTISFVLISFLSYSQVLINEFEPNPDGADPSTVSIELKGTPNTSFSGFLLSAECDGANGIIQDASEVSGTFDANGLLVISIPDLENPSFTLFLTDTFTGTVNVTDIDIDDDGIVDDTSSFNLVYDAIGIPDAASDESSIYGNDLGGTDFKYIGAEPFLVFRDANSDALFAVISPGDSEVFNVNAEAVPATNFTGTANQTSFGSANAYESTLALESSAITGLKLFPNPTSESSIVITAQNHSDIQVSVYDLIGKSVLEQKVKNDRLDISNLNAGVYILKLKQNDRESIKKLVVK